MDYESLSMVAFSSLIVIQTLTLAQETRYFTAMNHGVIWGTCLFYFFIIWLYNLIPAFDMYTVMNRLYADISFWFAIMVTTFLAITPVAIFNHIRLSAVRENRLINWDRLREERVLQFRQRLTQRNQGNGLRIPLLGRLAAEGQQEADFEMTESDSSKKSRHSRTPSSSRGALA
eukprot:TRINITY_DN248_c0_g1_i1.p1 TRINITY_DN248_c0_g1~~TRINITY_DN248_c0_g1_i1.p1  ORF type:complete len:174 (-),score=33.43 TRINITY_DN248_c0_g1_i1:71-592(-)